MNDDIIAATSAALTGKTIADVEYITDEPRPYWAVTFDDDTEISFVTMAELVFEGTPPAVPDRDAIRRYLDNQHCVLWGRNFDIISNPDEAVDWLHKVISNIVATR